LKAAGCTEIFQEKISGAKTDRKQLAKLISHLGQDDSLVVTRLDRRARSTNYLLNALGGFAEFERELIRSRTTEGRARAKAKGVVIGPQTETNAPSASRSDFGGMPASLWWILVRRKPQHDQPALKAGHQF
jgi:DNA invertase Pin-like site-specific DNA recombinase